MTTPGASDELHIRLEQKAPDDKPATVETKQPEPESQRVYRRMCEVIRIIEPSSISSHHKGETLRLLARLRDEEVLRLVAKESQR